MEHYVMNTIQWLQAVGEKEDGKLKVILVASGIFLIISFLFTSITLFFPVALNVALSLILMRTDNAHMEQLLNVSWMLIKKVGFIFLLALPFGSLVEGIMLGGELPKDDPLKHSIAVPILMIPGAFLLTTVVHWATASVRKLIVTQHS